MKLFSVLLILILSSVATLNSLVDIAGIGDYHSTEQATHLQKDGDILISAKPFNQRAWLKTRLLLGEKCPDLLILGSSTVGMWSSDMVPSGSLLNGWLTGPMIQDFEALVSILKKMKCRPQHIILGIDPWLFNAAEKNDRWVSLFSDYLEYHNTTALVAFAESIKQHWANLKERLNWVTTRETIKYLLKQKGLGTDDAIPKLLHVGPDEYCSQANPRSYVRSFDGHFTTCPQNRISAAERDSVAREYLNSNSHGVRKWSGVDQARLTQLRSLLDVLGSLHVNTVLVAPAYHPFTYQALVSDQNVNGLLAKMDSQLQEVATQHKMSFVNMRNPSMSGCTQEEFTDSHHAAPSCAEKQITYLYHQMNW